MKVATSTGVKVYNLSEGKSLPDWISEKKKRALRKDSEFQRRIELIQDFEFRAASQRIKLSDDGQYIIATGSYPPMIKCYDTKELSEKFKRHLDCEVVQFSLLSGDWRKMAVLESDRTIEVHAAYGTHFKTRIPRFGRDMVYNRFSCDLMIGGVSNEIYRLNLDQGRFMEPFSTDATAVNVLKLNPVHNLLGVGTENGTFECWDPRTRKALSVIDIKPECGSDDVIETSALAFDIDGLTVALGSSNGHCLVYDLRSSRPIYKKLHQNEMPIVSINFHNSVDQKLVLSADPKVLKVWNHKTGDLFCNIETPADINDVALVQDSGLIMMAVEQPRVLTYFVPSLGPAPKWSSFLESLTEELEEETPSLYDDFKFVTRDELESIGLSHMIGSDLLRAYMHGFFMDQRLYNRLKQVSDPFSYDTYRKAKIEEKISSKRSERITFQKKLPKVNKDLAERLINTPAMKKKILEDGKEVFDNPIGDNRFSKMFKSEDFEIDETSAEFQLRFPSGVPKKKTEVNDAVVEQFNKLSDDEESEEEGKPFDESSSDESDKDESEQEEEEKKSNNKKRKRFYELKDGSSMPEISKLNGTNEDEEQLKRKKILVKKSLGERIELNKRKDETSGSIIKRNGGIKEMTFEYDNKKRRSYDFDEKKRLKSAKDKNRDREEGGAFESVIPRGGFRGGGGGRGRGGQRGRGGTGRGGRGKGGRGGQRGGRR